MKISIVIPVYNEAEGLGACLDAIERQTIKPYEVIVVDNNSSDGSDVLAKKYNFVTLIREPKQGVVHARTAGFNAANGDIIARIDADTILPANWLNDVKSIFENDKNLDATSGLALYYGAAGAGLINALDLFFRRWLSRQLQNKCFLWGSNMAMKREAWHKVKSSLCQKGNQHEDFDIAIHLQQLGGKVTFNESLKANVSSRRIDVDFISFMHYVMISPSTYAQHKLRVKRFMYPVVLVCALGYIPGYILHKGYDPEEDKFSFSRLFFYAPTVGRVDPTANVA
jgi:glycosyltransferase involved in cell wall biosynthesis